ncbi:hypothetical protein LTR20_000690 [Exophiala xenobiotica]|nr:hypothetical protein LTR40_000307 [Exophiala xenobiotica]KAK5330272.1 hypothetical protein LTR93_001861 [Exophiala xenobiotica]KAK5353386.1 hypothetical protein LTR61_003344 [Exophiala xenobiotica]KAK5376278.1 hypothetical protein LTS13_005076 [Exophiala xenobiotica]KAK5396535.1 hypothetical protein LTR79_006263 [Exophiala xenobiotica]
MPQNMCTLAIASTSIVSVHRLPSSILLATSTMPLLSSTLLLRTHSLTLVIFAYYLLTSPTSLLSSAPIWLIGESMFVRPPAYASGQHPSNAGPDTGAFRPPALLQTPTRAQSPVTGSTSDRELFALLALSLLTYALMQFIFAGDLTLILPSGPTSIKSSGKSAATQSTSSSSSSSSRLAEELHTLLTAQSRWLTLAGLHVLASSGLVFWIYMFHSHAQSDATDSMFPGVGLLANRVTFTAGLADMLFWGYLWTVLKDEGREIGGLLARRRQIEEEDE